MTSTSRHLYIVQIPFIGNYESGCNEESFYKPCVASDGEHLDVAADVAQTLIRVHVCDPIIICFNQIPPLTIYNNYYYSTGQT